MDSEKLKVHNGVILVQIIEHASRDACSWKGQFEKNEKSEIFKSESSKWNWKVRVEVGKIFIT